MTRCSWILCMKIDRRRTHNKPEELSSIVNAAFGLRWTTPKISRFRGFTYGFTERGKPENLHEYWTFRIKVRWVRPQSRSSRTSVQQAIIYSLKMLKSPEIRHFRAFSMPRITWFRWWNLRKFDFKLAHFDGFTMGLRPIFEPNGWENGFTEGHFGGEISPISLTDFRQKSGWNGMKNSVRFVWRVLTNSAKK